MDQVIICRLCLNLLQPKEAVALFNSNGLTLMGTMVQAIYPIKLTEGDGPNSTCSECLVKVGNSYKLYKQVVRCQAQISAYWPSIPDILDSVGIFPDPILPASNGNEPSATGQSKLEKLLLGNVKPTPGKIKRHHIQSNNITDISSELDSVKEFVTTPTNTMHNVDSDDSVVENESSAIRQLRENRKRISYNESDNMHNEPHQCEYCDKRFNSLRSYHLHKRIHKVPPIPVQRIGNTFLQPKLFENDNSKPLILFTCELCGKKFKYQIQLKRHIHVCASSTNDAFDNLDGEEQCPYCTGKFNTTQNLRKHIRDTHAGASLPLSEVDTHASPLLPKESYEWVACPFCKEETFNSYKIFTNHIHLCPKRPFGGFFSCTPCNVQYSAKNSYFTHMRRKHFEAVQKVEKINSKVVEQPLHETDYEDMEDDSDGEQFECPVCLDGFARQDQLVEHLTVHMMEADDGPNSGNFNKARPVPLNSNEAVACEHCDRVFGNQRALNVHKNRQHYTKKSVAKNGKGSKNLESSDSEELDTTCNICDKIFSYRRTLLIHMKNKHRGIPGAKRTTVQFKKCRMRCLICDLEMTVEESFTHIKVHSVSSVKGKFEYQCRGCGAIFRTTQGLRDHIHTVHRHRKDSGSTGERTEDARNEFIGHTIGSEFSKEVIANIKTEIIDSSPATGHIIATRAQSKFVPEQPNKESEQDIQVSEKVNSPDALQVSPDMTPKQENVDAVERNTSPEQTEADSSQGDITEPNRIVEQTSSTKQVENCSLHDPNSVPEQGNSDITQTNSLIEQENSVPEQASNVFEQKNSVQEQQTNTPNADNSNMEQTNSAQLEESNKVTEQLKLTSNQLITKPVNVARKKTTQIPANIIEATELEKTSENTENDCEKASCFSDKETTSLNEVPSPLAADHNMLAERSKDDCVEEEENQGSNEKKKDFVNEVPDKTICRSGNVARKKTTQISPKDIQDLIPAAEIGAEEENGIPEDEWTPNNENMSLSEEDQSTDKVVERPAETGESEKPNKVPRVCLRGFTCPQCGKTLNNVRSLRSHINWHATRGKTMEKKIECAVCKEVFNYGTHYRIHMKSHWSDRNLDPKFLTCDTCGRRSATLRSAQIHARVHSTRLVSRPHHTCAECGKKFQFRKYYLTHMLTHHNDQNDIET